MRSSVNEVLMFQAVRTAAVGVCAAIALCVPTPALAAGPDLTTWLFAEGSTNAAFGFEEEILIGNPNPTQITVKFELFTQDGESLEPVVVTVEPLSRYGASIRTIVGDRAGVALRLTSSAPIVAERTMYWAAGCSAAASTGTRRSPTCAAATTSTVS